MSWVYQLVHWSKVIFDDDVLVSVLGAWVNDLSYVFLAGVSCVISVIIKLLAHCWYSCCFKMSPFRGSKQAPKAQIALYSVLNALWAS